MEFPSGNDCSGVALIALIIYSSLGLILDCALSCCSALLCLLCCRNCCSVAILMDHCLKCQVRALPHQNCSPRRQTHNNSPSQRNFRAEMTVLVSHQWPLSHTRVSAPESAGNWRTWPVPWATFSPELFHRKALQGRVRDPIRSGRQISRGTFSPKKWRGIRGRALLA